MTGIGREILWGVPGWAPAAMYSAFAVVVLVAGAALLARVSAWRSGRAEREDRFDRIPSRLSCLLRLALLQSKVLERSPSGIFHACVFSGFLAMTVATALVAVHHDLGVRILDGIFYLAFKLFADAFGLLLLAGCACALVRRLSAPSPGHLRGAGEILPLALLLAVAATGFLVETLRIAATRPSAGWASFASNGAARLLGDVPFGTLLSAHASAWWVHLGLAFLFLASIPFSKSIHLLTAPASVFLGSSRPKGALQDVPDIGESERPGVLAVTDFSWKQLLSVDACTRCGRCHEECPAQAAGMPLSPRDVVLRTSASLHGGGFASPLPTGAFDLARGDGFAGRTLTPETIWSCTTCRACVESCPVSIEQLDMIVDVRRGFVSEGRIPDGARLALRRMRDTGNPWGMPQAGRMDWAEGLPVPLAADRKSVPLLYWVGCASAYDPRARKVARSIASLLLNAGVDFAVLGPEERCCGESARRLGEEGLFRLGIAEAVREAFSKYGVRELVTGCPHCFNTFRNEYPALGIRVAAHHHSGFLSALVSSGKLRPLRAYDSTVVYHDACYLGRHNGSYREPRRVVTAIPGIRLVDASRSWERSFCCGGGGGAMWIDPPGGRINRLRLDQLRATGASEIASACPYCLAMFEDASRGDDSPRARDIAEILVRSCSPEGIPLQPQT